MQRKILVPVAILCALSASPALADWSCQIVDRCMAGDMCRQPPEPLHVMLKETSEAWLLAPEGMAATVLNALSERRALPFIAVSAEAQGFEQTSPSVTSLVITEDGALTVSEIDLAPGVAVPVIYRGTCSPG